MKKTLLICLMLIPVLAWAYSPPTDYQMANDRVITNAGQEVELQAMMIGDEPNPNFIKYRNASARVWLKDKDTFRILAEVNGKVLTGVPLATGTASCGALQSQPVFVRMRIEKATVQPEAPVREVEVIR